MRQNYSRLSDLRSLFERAITVSIIAEPLASFDHDADAERVRVFMREKQFDVVGVRSEGLTIGYVHKNSFRNSRGLDYRLFDTEERIDHSASLVAALRLLSTRERAFVEHLGHVTAIVTKADLQKQAVRTWLFGMISLVEMRMGDLIRHLFPHDGWKGVYDPEQVKRIESEYRKAERANIARDRVAAMYFPQKSGVLMRHGDIQAVAGIPLGELEHHFSGLHKLRNTLAHMSPLPVKEWESVSSRAEFAERFIEAVDNYLGDSHARIREVLAAGRPDMDGFNTAAADNPAGGRS